MSKQSDQVTLGFMRLTASERAEVFRKITEFQNTSDLRKSIVTEEFRVNAGLGLDLGPMNTGGCRCCGR
jgi:hypothetical protein